MRKIAGDGQGMDGPASAARRASGIQIVRTLLEASPMALGVLVVISVISNLLMLTGPLYMLQVYDRVLVSRSVPTLVALSILAAAMFGFYAVLEILRSRMAARYAGIVEEALVGPVARALIRTRSRGAETDDPASDLDTFRQFLGGSGAISLLDLPWVPVYLALIFAFHPMLGWVAASGGGVMVVLLLVNERLSQGTARGLGVVAQRRRAIGRDLRESGDPIAAMGMIGTMTRRWQAAAAEQLASHIRMQDQGSIYSSLTKGFRLMLQSAVLGTGAYLAINEAMTAGLMLAASVITARALAPVEQSVAQWRGFVSARQAYARLLSVVARDASRPAPATELRLPRATLDVTRLAVHYGTADKPALVDIDLTLSAGDGLAVLGLSGSGKSTLARALVGLMVPSHGDIRFDGSEFWHFDRDRLGAATGYLPQDVDLFDGTIAQNISRFRPDATDESIIAAAEAAHVHQLIASLPQGYDTPIGPRGSVLSGGQRQRIGLARALFGDPFLLVLDEPNSNLDTEGEDALTQALLMARHRGAIVVVVAHRRNAVATMNKLLLLEKGRQVDFGSKDDVMRRLQGGKAATSIRTGTDG